MALLTKSQRAFGSELARLTGLDTRLVGAWLLHEMSGPHAQRREREGNYNWLNIGYTDAGQRGTGNAIWRDPISAARATARWLRGEWSVPGFGRAAPGIVAFSRTAGRPLQAQIDALRRSGWATSGYPELPGLVSRYGGRFGLRRAGGVPAVGGRGAGGGAGDAPVIRLPVPQLSPLAMVLGAERPQAASTLVVPEGVPMSSPPMPEGWRPVETAGGPVARRSALAEAIAAVGQMQGGESTVELPQLAPGGAAPAPRGRLVPERAAGQIARGLQFAVRRLGVTETMPNRGKLIDAWQRSFGMLGQPWCGVSVGKVLQAAGVPGVDGRIAGTANIVAMARRGEGPFVGLVSAKQVRPGDVVVWNPGPNGHTGVVEQVNRDGTITTIEGNASNAVRRRVHPRSGAFFARPRYRA